MVMPHAKQDDEFSPYSVANLYRKAGYLGTIPLPYNEKHPPPKGFTGASAPYPDSAKIAEWLGKGRANIALRLAEVPGYRPKGSPYDVELYELIGIDVDDYASKAGAEQLHALEGKFGPLPKTVCSSSRWKDRPNSGIRLFLVPAGYHFLGKADTCIEIIQKGHRFMVVWPSVNPDAGNTVYRFRAPGGAFYDETGEGAGVPPLDDIAVLPEKWLDYLTCGRMIATDRPMSKLAGSELLEWAAETFNDSSGEMCRRMSEDVFKYLTDIEEDSLGSHHELLSRAHWRIIRNAAEGHSGWVEAMKKFNNSWIKWVTGPNGREGAMMDELVSEIHRSVIGCISKAEPTLEGYIPEDECAIGNVHALHDVDHWTANIEDDDDTEADPNDNDLGPIIRRMAKYQTERPDAYDMNDHGNAAHFVDIYGVNAKYVDSRRSWVLWDGYNWNRDTGDKLTTRAFSVVEQRQKLFSKSIPRDSKANIAKSEAWRKWALRSGNVNQISNALALARTLYTSDGEEPVALSGKEFDVDPRLLGCENGILVLDRDPYLRPAKKEDYVTYNTHTPYIPWDTNLADEQGVLEGYKLWSEYLDIFLPDVQVRHFIQKVMGHLLIGENPEKLLIFIYGPHDTGKSTMLGGISSALGDYYGTIDINLFSNSKLNPKLIRAVPLRVAGMSEVDSGKMDASVIKRLTGNDRVTAEAKFSNEIFEGRPQFTTLIACNNEPDISGVDEALQERILVLPFEYQINTDKRRYERQVDIERMSGIAVLSWLVEGWKMYCKEGLKRDTWPLDVKRLCGSIVGHLNSTQAFIAECIDKTSPETMEARQIAFDRATARRRAVPNASDWDMDWTPTTARVYELYSRWCAANGERQISLHDLTKELGVGKAQVKNVDGESKRVYVGFRIKNGKDD